MLFAFSCSYLTKLTFSVALNYFKTEKNGDVYFRRKNTLIYGFNNLLFIVHFEGQWVGIVAMNIKLLFYFTPKIFINLSYDIILRIVKQNSYRTYKSIETVPSSYRYTKVNVQKKSLLETSYTNKTQCVLALIATALEFSWFAIYFDFHWRLLSSFSEIAWASEQAFISL